MWCIFADVSKKDQLHRILSNRIPQVRGRKRDKSKDIIIMTPLYKGALFCYECLTSHYDIRVRKIPGLIPGIFIQVN